MVKVDWRKRLEEEKERFKRYVKKHGKVPTEEEFKKDEELKGIRVIGAIRRGKFIFPEEGIRIETYNDFVRYCGYKPNRESKPHGYWKGLEGLKRGVEEVKKLVEELGRIPSPTEIKNRLPGFYRLIGKHYYKECGVEKIEDVYELAGLEPFYKNHLPYTIESLEEEIKKFIEENGRMPKSEEMRNITLALSRKGISFSEICFEVLLKHFLPPIFSEEEVKEYYKAHKERGSPKKALNKLLKRNKIFYLGNGFYTSNQEIAEMFSEKPARKRKRRKGVYHHATQIIEIGDDAEVEIKEVKKGRRKRRVKKEEKTIPEIELTEIDEQRLKILRIAKADPSQLDGKELEEYFEIYDKYLARKHKVLLKELLEGIEEGSKILDLGCGVSAPAYQALDGKRVEYLGVDQNEKIIEHNKKLGGEFLRVLIPYEMHKLNENYDYIIASYFFDSLNEPEILATLAKAHNLLKKNGEFLIVLSKGNEDTANFIAKALKNMGYDVKDNLHRVEFKSEKGKAYEYVYVIRARKIYDYDAKPFADDMEKVALFSRKEFNKLRKEEVDEILKMYKDIRNSHIPFIYIEEKYNQGLEKINEMENMLNDIEKELNELEEKVNFFMSYKFWRSEEGFREGIKRAEMLTRKLKRIPNAKEFAEEGLEMFLNCVNWGEYEKYGIRNRDDLENYLLKKILY